MGKGPNIYLRKVKKMKSRLRTDITTAEDMSEFSTLFQAARTYLWESSAHVVGLHTSSRMPAHDRSKLNILTRRKLVSYQIILFPCKLHSGDVL